MGILAFLVFGFVVGLVARAIMPGDQKMGILGTTIVGVVGSFIGGALGSLLTNARVADFTTAGFLGSVIGAFLLLLAVSGLARNRVVA